MPRHAHYHQLPPPTPAQLACPRHRWRVTHTRPDRSYAEWPWDTYPYPKRRYLRCQRCGLRARTTERLDVPRPPEIPKSPKPPRHRRDPLLRLADAVAPPLPQECDTIGELAWEIEATIAYYVRYQGVTVDGVKQVLTRAWMRQDDWQRPGAIHIAPRHPPTAR